MCNHIDDREPNDSYKQLKTFVLRIFIFACAFIFFYSYCKSADNTNIYAVKPSLYPAWFTAYSTNPLSVTLKIDKKNSAKLEKLGCLDLVSAEKQPFRLTRLIQSYAMNIGTQPYYQNNEWFLFQFTSTNTTVMNFINYQVSQGNILKLTSGCNVIDGKLIGDLVIPTTAYPADFWIPYYIDKSTWVITP